MNSKSVFNRVMKLAFDYSTRVVKAPPMIALSSKNSNNPIELFFAATSSFIQLESIKLEHCIDRTVSSKLSKIMPNNRYFQEKYVNNRYQRNISIFAGKHADFFPSMQPYRSRIVTGEEKERIILELWYGGLKKYKNRIKLGDITKRNHFPAYSIDGDLDGDPISILYDPENKRLFRKFFVFPKKIALKVSTLFPAFDGFSKELKDDIAKFDCDIKREYEARAMYFKAFGIDLNDKWTDNIFEVPFKNMPFIVGVPNEELMHRNYMITNRVNVEKMDSGDSMDLKYSFEVLLEKNLNLMDKNSNNVVFGKSPMIKPSLVSLSTIYVVPPKNNRFDILALISEMLDNFHSEASYVSSLVNKLYVVPDFFTKVMKDFNE